MLFLFKKRFHQKMMNKNEKILNKKQNCLLESNSSPLELVSAVLATAPNLFDIQWVWLIRHGEEKTID